MLNGQRKTVSDKNRLFIQNDKEPKYVRVSPDDDEYLKVWVKEPTWLQVEQAMAVVMKLNPKTQEMDIDLNSMYRYICLLYTSPSPRDQRGSRMPSSA